MTRKQAKIEAEQSIKRGMMLTSLVSRVGKNPDCDQHKLVETDKSIGMNKWACATCGMTLTSTVS